MYRWPAVELGGALPPTDRLRLLANAGDVRMSQDMPDAEEALRYVLDECRRLGDAGSGSAAANLALMWLFLGRWNEVLLLLEEALEAIPVADTVLTLALRAQLVHHAALIGDVESARGHLSADGREHSEDSQDRAAAGCTRIAAVAAGNDGNRRPLSRHATAWQSRVAPDRRWRSPRPASRSGLGRRGAGARVAAASESTSCARTGRFQGG